ncbi:hypothetical protein GIW45_26925 [Pseudomonas congelans]|uniref:hypothetical protein n=1 Tax=Pseudomonas congelans TaxID=200452 RepID=UPI001F4388D6|nr:hypothetical protein [Pseudomonas congelans]MCF5167561.1 hypothetical protein [Pseudomonas congelans]
MYVGLELTSYQSYSSVPWSQIQTFKQQVQLQFSEVSDYLVEVFEGRCLIDAEKLSRHFFPRQEKTHVFLSHSHADEKRAIELAIKLRDRGVNVFVDSCVWGASQHLLEKLIGYHAEQKADASPLSEREVSDLAAGVHLMLVGALQEMIDRTELFVFLNTENSIPLKAYEGADRTFSPWINSELQFSAMVRRRVPARRTRRPRDVLSLENIRAERRLPDFALKALNSHLPKVNGSEFSGWIELLLEKGEAALDSLYEGFEIPGQFRRLRAQSASRYKRLL